jgi:hypothetical protein
MCTTDGACSYPEKRKATCPICKQPVSLERCKTDEDGRAIHEDCYVRKICSGIITRTVTMRPDSLG